MKHTATKQPLEAERARLRNSPLFSKDPAEIEKYVANQVKTIEDARKMIVLLAKHAVLKP